LAIKRRIGNVAGEAVTLHQLATIELQQGDHPAARENFRRALIIWWRIGDPAGEATTLYQFGSVGVLEGRPEAGARLIAACVVIEQRIGHGDTAQDIRTLLGLCQKLGYDETRVQTLLDEVAASLARDRGQSLLRDAFPEMNW